MEFRGAYTALVTPFKNGEIDEEAYREFIEWQIEQGIDGLVSVGTTGESATLDHQEHMDVIRICVDQVKGRVPVVAGTGANNTQEAIDLTKFAKEVGADASLQVTPYYNKPSQEGLVAHFKAIAKAAPMPIIVYNVPGRTSLNLLPQTMARIAREIPEVLGIKEASGNLAQVSDVIEYCPAGFQVLSGDDFTVLPLLALGGTGVISVVSNVAPADTAALCKAFLRGDLAAAKALHYKLAPLNRAMFLEVNPVPVKTALAMMGRIPNGDLRLPLVPLLPANEAKLREILATAGLL